MAFLGAAGGAARAGAARVAAARGSFRALGRLSQRLRAGRLGRATRANRRARAAAERIISRESRIGRAERLARENPRSSRLSYEAYAARAEVFGGARPFGPEFFQGSRITRRADGTYDRSKANQGVGVKQGRRLAEQRRAGREFFDQLRQQALAKQAAKKAAIEQIIQEFTEAGLDFMYQSCGNQGQTQIIQRYEETYIQAMRIAGHEAEESIEPEYEEYQSNLKLTYDTREAYDGTILITNAGYEIMIEMVDAIKKMNFDLSETDRSGPSEDPETNEALGEEINPF